MRFHDLLKDIHKVEQKLENVLLYVDFLDHPLPIILLKDGSLLILFEISGVDYEGLSEEDKQQFSYYSRTALEQLPDEGNGFMLSNLLVRDTPDIIPLKRNPSAHPLIQYVHDKKQSFWDRTIQESFGNRIFCGLRYFNPRKREAPWSLLIQEGKTFQFYLDQLRSSVERLEQAHHTLASAYARFGFRALDRQEAFSALYELVNFSQAPAYRPDFSLNAQLAHSRYLFRPNEEYVVINDSDYCSLIGVRRPPAKPEA